MTISTDSKSAGRIVFALQIVQFQIAAAIVAIAAYRLLGTNIRTQRIETMVLGVVRDAFGDSLIAFESNSTDASSTLCSLLNRSSSSPTKY